jgi:4-amino-4-deoxy-L-arabinose transferase-like glycosyltransferase
MVAWMMAAGRWMAGDTPFGIRLPAVLASLLGPFLLWRTAAILFDRDIAVRSVWLALAMPLLAVGSIVMTPDTPSVLFWGLSAWALAELHASRNANWWLVVGLFAGLGLLSKYTNLFVGAGIVLWLILLPANWRWLRSWQLWAGGILACLLALPVLVWNLHHEWASFAKQFGRVGHGVGLTFRYLPEFVGAYLGLASPVIAVLSLRGLGMLARAAACRDQAGTMVVAGVLPLLAYFLVHALGDRVQPNWVAPLYPALAICAAVALASFAAHAARRLGGSGLVIGFVLSALLFVHALHPLWRPPDLKDPTAQMRGWSELAAELEDLRLANGAHWIATSSYATTGQLAFALRSGPPIVQLTERVRYAHLPPADQALLQSPALYVELERRERPDLLRESFASVTPLGHLVRRDGALPVATFCVYRVADPLKPTSP